MHKFSFMPSSAAVYTLLQFTICRAPQKSIKCLQLMRNTAARTRTQKYDHITPILASLHWQPVVLRIDFFYILLLVLKPLNGLAPPYLVDLLIPYTPDRNLHSANQLLLSVACRAGLQTEGRRAVTVRAPHLQNNLHTSYLSVLF